MPQVFLMLQWIPQNEYLIYTWWHVYRQCFLGKKEIRMHGKSLEYLFWSSTKSIQIREQLPDSNCNHAMFHGSQKCKAKVNEGNKIGYFYSKESFHNRHHNDNNSKCALLPSNMLSSSSSTTKNKRQDSHRVDTPTA
jgi:hypothetical protein